jgi:hypothetical protein
LASLRRFWAVAASRNSSFAPHGPRNLSLFRPRMRLRWAKSISTFFRSFIEITYCSVFAMSRATWRASSCSSRVIDRKSMLGQQRDFEGQAWHVCFRHRYLATPLPVGPRFGSLSGRFRGYTGTKLEEVISLEAQHHLLHFLLQVQSNSRELRHRNKEF